MILPSELQRKVTISPDALCQEIDGETVILDLKSEAYFGLDPLATKIWQGIGKAQSLEQVVVSILQEFDVEESVVVEDLQELIADLSAAGLITIE